MLCPVFTPATPPPRVFFTLLAAFVTACGGGGSSNNILTGFFIDAPVSGLGFLATSGERGITGVDGGFKYNAGDSITFSIGGIIIGTAIGDKFVTPNDIEGLSTSATINVARFLLTLDSDSNPDNGITITPEVSLAAASLSVSTTDFEDQTFESSGLVQFATDANGDSRYFVDSDTAEAHLLDTEVDLADGEYHGPADADRDGVRDAIDNCPTDPNIDQVDTDSDGVGDACDSQHDTDSDSDGIRDEVDNCPGVSNSAQVDIDGDDIGDICDPQDKTDTDGDGDGDGDGVNDTIDNCPAIANFTQADVDNDGVGDACDTQDDRDGDLDGIRDELDNCPGISNADQADADGDSIGDACDPQNGTDLDGDGIRDEVDNCPVAPNGGQTDIDEDGIGDTCDPQNDTDSDGDGIRDEVDNCLAATNADQADFDSDGQGDVCDSQDDTDTDGDGIRDEIDDCPDTLVDTEVDDIGCSAPQARLVDNNDVDDGKEMLHVVYAIPADREPSEIDLDGTIEHSLRAMNSFFGLASGGRTFRFDLTRDSKIEITLAFLNHVDSYYADQGLNRH